MLLEKEHNKNIKMIPLIEKELRFISSDLLYIKVTPCLRRRQFYYLNVAGSIRGLLDISEIHLKFDLRHFLLLAFSTKAAGHIQSINSSLNRHYLQINYL